MTPYFKFAGHPAPTQTGSIEATRLPLELVQTKMSLTKKHYEEVFDDLFQKGGETDSSSDWSSS